MGSKWNPLCVSSHQLLRTSCCNTGTHLYAFYAPSSPRDSTLDAIMSMLKNLFSKPPTVQEQVRDAKRDMRKGEREIQREIMALQTEEKKTIAEIKVGRLPCTRFQLYRIMLFAVLH